MTRLVELFPPDVFERLGWMLLHSLWQAALVALLLLWALAALRRRSANARYAASCGALAIMLAAPAATFVAGWGGGGGKTAGATAIGTLAPAAGSQGAVPAADPSRNRGDVGGGGGAARSDAPPARAAESHADLDSDRPTPRAEAPAGRGTRARLSDWSPAIVLAWLAGVVALTLWNLGGWVAVQRLRRVCTTPVPGAVAERFAALARRMRVSRPVQLLQSALADVPVAAGWLRPVVLVPASVLTGLTPQQLDAVLAHELAHVRRNDYLVNLLQALAETLLFYHPAVWWVSRRVRAEREHCCDDAAVAACGSRVRYAEALALVEQVRPAPLLAVAAAGRGGRGVLRRRVERVLRAGSDGNDGNDVPRAGLAAAAVLLVLAAVALPLNALRATATATTTPDSDPAPADTPDRSPKAAVEQRPPPPPPAPARELPRGLEFLKPFPEFHDFRFGMNEPSIRKLARRHGLKVAGDVTKGITVERADGQTLAISMRHGKCVGIQRLGLRTGAAGEGPGPGGADDGIDGLLAEADAKLRNGLLRLAEKFPQLRRTNHGALQEQLTRAPPGEIRLHVGLYPRGPGKSHGIDAAVAEAARWGVTVIVQRADADSGQLSIPMPAHARLKNVVNAWAGDPELERALNALVVDALRPVGERDQQQQQERAEVKRRFLIGIVGKLAALKAEYPELAAFEEEQLRRQVEASAAAAAEHGQGFEYHYRFTPHDRNKIPHFGEHGCAITVGFAKLDDPSAMCATRDLPALGAQARWYVGLSKDSSPGVREEVNGVIMAAVDALEKRLASEAGAGANARPVGPGNGGRAVAGVIELLGRPWHERLTPEQLDGAAASLKPSADESVEALMAAFHRDGQEFVFRHRAVQVLERLATPKARAALLDVAMGRTDEDVPSLEAWAAQAYIATLKDKADARPLLASDDPAVLNVALLAVESCAVDEPLLDRLVELLRRQPPEMAVRHAAASVLAGDPRGGFAARKVSAILEAVADVPNMPDRGKVGFLGNWTMAEISYARYLDCLSLLKGKDADAALRDATVGAEGTGRDLLLIARARRGDRTVRDEVRRILGDGRAGMLRAWAARSLPVIGTADDLDLLRKVAESDPLERDYGGDVGPPGGRQKGFPVRDAARDAIREIENRKPQKQKGGGA